MNAPAKSEYSNWVDLFLALDSRTTRDQGENCGKDVTLPTGSNVILETIHQAIRPQNANEQRDEWQSDWKQWGDDQVTYPDGSPWVNGWEDAVNNPR